MKVLDLFCGTKSIANAFKARGHEVYTVDWDKQFEPTLCADIGKLTAKDIINLCGGKPDVIWASPDCTTYSVAAISTHRKKSENGELLPVSEYAKLCDKINKNLIALIKELNPRYWFIENPVGALRKMSFMEGLPRYTVTYCQYGERRQKPTDIWTNHENPKFKPQCKRGAPCHDSAPRGSRTGTQGLKNRIEKARIPEMLCDHIVEICEIEEIERKEIKTMELRIESFQMPEKILFNFEELKKEITAKTAHFETLVYTEEQIKDAKADKAALNKLKKALNDERIKREREYMQSFNEFKGQINEIIGIIDRSVIAVDKQVKAYDEHTKQLKKEAIIGIYEGFGFPAWVDFGKIFDEKWLNATTKEKAIQEALESKYLQITADLTTLAELPEFGFEATEEYKRTLDINRAIAEGRRLAEIQKQKVAFERAGEAIKKATELFENLNEATKKAIPTETPKKTPEKQWLSFRALLSIEDAQALKDLFISRNIKFEAI